MSKKDISLQALMEALHYDPDTGIFAWKMGVHESWTGRKAGTINSDGYVRIAYKKTGFKAHRIAWAFCNRRMPDDRMHIDHINGIKTDNRIANLRLCSAKENCENMKMPKSNKVGLKGVSRSGGRFRAHITHHRKQIHLGCFETPQEAHAAYCAAAKNLNWIVHRAS